MTVFVDKTELEMEILGMAVCEKERAMAVIDICADRDWDDYRAYAAIEQVKKHGKILDHHLREYPPVRNALLRPLDSARIEDLEELCWNHLCIVNTDTQMMLLGLTKRKDYDDLRRVLEEVLRENLKRLEEDAGSKDADPPVMAA